ncbi:MAG: fibrobacter succinogenes major paralogous domain-containing protein [Bacteroidales bacterium]|nr:fibrobacter succinogenes major paralogous domain-containing protein [Bacteroidales bacterium]
MTDAEGPHEYLIPTTSGEVTQLPANWTENDPSSPQYILNKPTNVSAFTNDAGYITMDSIPSIPTEVSAFINDAGYLTADSLAELNNQLAAMQHALDSLQQVIEDDHFLCGTSTVTDVDGNVYNTVDIGKQCWMRENLRTTHYPDGTEIPLSTTISENTPYRHNPCNDENTVPTYGYLYNWPAVMHGSASSNANPSGVQGICPDGWHVPSDAEWTQLTTTVSSNNEFICNDNADNIAKALAATMGWYSNSNDCAVGNDLSANNATGFSVLPAGLYYDGGYSYFGYDAYFWSATQGNDSYAYNRFLRYNGADVASGYVGSNKNKAYGYSVRCVRD